jgi:hypothetical protein
VGHYALQYHVICMLDLPVRAGVSDYCSVYPDVVVVTEIQELLLGELGAVVDDDRVGDPKQKTMFWIRLTACLELILAKGLASIHLVNLLTSTSRWVKPPGAFLKGPKRSRPHTTKEHVMGIVWSSWAGVWICHAKYWYPLQDLTI